MEQDFPIGIRISQIKLLQSRIFQQILKKYANADLNSAQTNIMFALWQKDDITISELSMRTNLAKTTLTSMLDRLESSGFLRRVPNPANRRETKICLTRQALQLKEKCWEAYDEMSAVNFSGFAREEKEALLKALDKLYNNLFRYSEEHKL